MQHTQQTLHSPYSTLTIHCTHHTGDSPCSTLTRNCTHRTAHSPNTALTTQDTHHTLHSQTGDIMQHTHQTLHSHTGDSPCSTLTRHCTHHTGHSPYTALTEHCTHHTVRRRSQSPEALHPWLAWIPSCRCTGQSSPPAGAAHCGRQPEQQQVRLCVCVWVCLRICGCEAL